MSLCPLWDSLRDLCACVVKITTPNIQLKRAIVPLILLLVATTSAAAQNAPAVLKVEPPNWWINHSINPVRVMVRGRNFRDAKVEAVGAEIRTSQASTNQAGTYLFVDVQIDPHAKPGRRALRITTSSGVVEAPFEISAPLERANRFQGFTPDDVLYLIMPDRFMDGNAANNNPPSSPGLYDRRKGRYYHGGDFAGIRKRLPYIKELGVTAIWLNPWYDNVNHLNEREQYEEGPITDYHGYGAVDFYGVEEHFGTLAELKELVDEAHRLGLKVIQDQVANHSGPYHPWVKDQPTGTWFNGTAAKHLTNPFQPWTLQDPRANYEAKRATLDGWFINVLPDLNQGDEETKRYIIQNTLWWIGITGLDAIRQDTLPYVPRAFWRDWMTAIKREYPNVNVVGELYDGDPALVSFFQGGVPRFDGVDSKVDSLFDFPLFYPVRRAFAENRSLRDIVQMLARDHVYPNPQMLVTFIGNHDMLRFMNEPGANITGLRLAQTFVMTTRGVPQLYYGDEIAIHGGPDPDNRRDFPGGFPGDARDAFTREGRTFDEQIVFEHVQKLARLRRELEPLRRGTLINLYVAEQQYAYARTTPQQTVLIIFNNDSKTATIEFDVASIKLPDGRQLRDRLQMNAFGARVKDVQINNGVCKVEMPGRTAAILTIKQ
ncbi:MAG: cyclomaltodextrinase N-terminal domain-containing protein [Pyrinomonadaceae bacterium]|nr:cyclomaltodextrinase N-terminal domain-containing protein [Pyrinomonadaceae bacterium]